MKRRTVEEARELARILEETREVLFQSDEFEVECIREKVIDDLKDVLAELNELEHPYAVQIAYATDPDGGMDWVTEFRFSTPERAIEEGKLIEAKHEDPAVRVVCAQSDGQEAEVWNSYAHGDAKRDRAEDNRAESAANQALIEAGHGPDCPHPKCNLPF